jgi:ADP-ribose pyrophosphatase YjhB (NUDIX family)
MISFDVAEHRFNLRAAAIFLQDDLVLLHRMEDDAIWALPGGRVEPGEDAASAVVREMMEELGEAVQCGELLYVVENFFEHRSKSNHEVGLYFVAHLKPESVLRVPSHSHFGIEGSSRLEFRWFPRSELLQVNLHPSFLRATLAKPILVFEHVVQRG